MHLIHCQNSKATLILLILFQKILSLHLHKFLAISNSALTIPTHPPFQVRIVFVKSIQTDTLYTPPFHLNYLSQKTNNYSILFFFQLILNHFLPFSQLIHQKKFLFSILMLLQLLQDFQLIYQLLQV